MDFDYQLSLDDIRRIERSEALLIDVRTTDELLKKEYKGTIHWDPRMVVSGRLPDIPKHKTIYIFCERGNAAQLALAAFTSAGFSEVYSLGELSELPERFRVNSPSSTEPKAPSPKRTISPLERSDDDKPD